MSSPRSPTTPKKKNPQGYKKEQTLWQQSSCRQHDYLQPLERDGCIGPKKERGRDCRLQTPDSRLQLNAIRVELSSVEVLNQNQNQNQHQNQYLECQLESVFELNVRHCARYTPKETEHTHNERDGYRAGYAAGTFCIKIKANL